MDKVSDELFKGKAFKISMLWKRYKLLLQNHRITAETYTSQRLKLQLKKCFGHDIIFHKPYDCTKSQLVYSSAISQQDVINSAYQQNASREEPHHQPQAPSNEAVGDCDRVRLLYHTAQLIKSEFKDCQGISVRPVDVTDLSLTKSKSLIPDSLYWV